MWSHITQGALSLNGSMQQTTHCALLPSPTLNLFSSSRLCWALTWVRNKLLLCQTTGMLGLIWFIWWNWWFFFVWLETVQELHLLININITSPPFVANGHFLSPSPMLHLFWVSSSHQRRQAGSPVWVNTPRSTCHFANSNTKKVFRRK